MCPCSDTPRKQLVLHVQADNAALRSQQRTTAAAADVPASAFAGSTQAQPSDATWIAFEELSPAKPPSAPAGNPFPQQPQSQPQQPPSQPQPSRPRPDDPFTEGSAFGNGSTSAVTSPGRTGSPSKRGMGAGITSPKAALMASVQAASAASAAAERTSSFGVSSEQNRPAR